jgi:octaprenyl-diphosphate synthase
MTEAVRSQIQRYIDELQSPVVRELFSRLPSGKMLRSKLILSIASGQQAVELAAIVELIHAASLLHDDVIDEADTRRGVPSINATNGDKSAVMLGDILYSKAFFELSRLTQPIPQVVSRAVTLLSLGELEDVELAKGFHPDRDAYMEMVYKKTGSLIEASAEAAAYIAGDDPKSHALFGKNLGIAFQIVDDILDITQDSATLGKPAMQDFAEGKTTLPYIYLYEALDEAQKERLRELWGRALEPEDEAWLRERLEGSGALKRCREDARALAAEALEAVGGRPRLAAIMQKLIDRTY